MNTSVNIWKRKQKTFFTLTGMTQCFECQPVHQGVMVQFSVRAYASFVGLITKGEHAGDCQLMILSHCCFCFFLSHSSSEISTNIFKTKQKPHFYPNMYLQFNHNHWYVKFLDLVELESMQYMMALLVNLNVNLTETVFTIHMIRPLIHFG